MWREMKEKCGGVRKSGGGVKKCIGVWGRSGKFVGEWVEVRG